MRNTAGPTEGGTYSDNLPETGQLAPGPILLFFGDEIRRELAERRRTATPPAAAEAGE